MEINYESISFLPFCTGCLSSQNTSLGVRGLLHLLTILPSGAVEYHIDTNGIILKA